VKRHLILVAAVLAAAVLAGGPLAATRTAGGLKLTTISGAGLKPHAAVTLSAAALAALPQSTLTVTIGGKQMVEKGPQLTQVIAKAGIRSQTSCDDELDHYYFEATTATGGAAVVSSVELAPDGGDRIVLLSLNENGAALSAPRMIVQGDKSSARDLTGVTGITIGRVMPVFPSNQPGCDPPGFKPTVKFSTAAADIGAVTVSDPAGQQQVMTFPQIQALPAVTQVDTYQGEGETKQHQEHGPTLYNFLVKADPALASLGSAGLRYYVELTSSEDGTVSIVSWAEIAPQYDNKPFVLSTYEDGNLILDEDTGPRITAPGDAGGTRYDYGIQSAAVFEAPAA
jgi:hypothetical protein